MKNIQYERGWDECMADLLKRLPKPIKWKRELLEQQYEDRGFNECLREIKNLLTPNK